MADNFVLLFLVVYCDFYWRPLNYNQQKNPFGACAFDEVRDTKPKPILHLASVTTGYAYVVHTLNVMKVMLLLTEADIHCYVFTTDNSTQQLTSEVARWPYKYRQRISITFTPMMCNQLLQFHGLKSPKSLKSKSIKQCAFCSFDKPSIRNFTDKFIFLDVDILPVDDLVRAWGIFSTFNDEQIMGMSRADTRYIKTTFPTYDARYGLNSGVIFVNLKNMVRFDFEAEYVQCANEMDNYEHIKGAEGDQNILNIYFYKYPYQAVPVGCNWNYRASMEICEPGNPYNCDEAKPLGVSIIHATRDSLLEKGHFSALYNCSLKIDLENVNQTLKCFKEGISYFNRRINQTCKHHVHYLRPLEITLQKRFSDYYGVL